MKDNSISFLIKVAALSIFIVSISIGYYFIFYLPKKEQRIFDLQIQQQETKDFKEKQEKEEIRQALESCISDAQNTYQKQWDSECESRGLLSTSCKELINMDAVEYTEKYGVKDAASEEDFKKNIDIFTEYYNKLDDCSCRLPVDIADRINKSLGDNKDICFKKYPQ